MEHNEKTENKGRKKKKSFSGVMNTISYIMLILGVSFLLSAAIILLSNDVLGLVKADNEVKIVLSENTTPGQMAKLLKKDGVIRYSGMFHLFSNVKKVKGYEAGTYSVNANMDYSQIISSLQGTQSSRKTETVTIPEGFTMKDICALLVDKGIVKEDAFWETANTYPFSHFMLKDVPMVENRLEGYLFPDTYEFYVGDNAVSVINKMLNNFVKKYNKAMRNLTEANGMTIAEVVNIASLIEKEAQVPDERTMIGGVIRNRLNSSSFPYLEVDASILYVTGHKEKLTAEDLKIDSPYNTYNHQGLPPTAICNPGAACLMAAIQPEKHSYYFYVATSDGSHIFSRTLAQHLAAKAKVESEKK